MCVCVHAHMYAKQKKNSQYIIFYTGAFASKSELKKLYLVIMRYMTYF